MVLFNEAWNKDRRGLGSAFIQGSAVLASASASIVGIWAITAFSQDWGWRVALLTGGSPIILMVFIRFFMPELRFGPNLMRKGGAEMFLSQFSARIHLLRCSEDRSFAFRLSVLFG